MLEKLNEALNLYGIQILETSTGVVKVVTQRHRTKEILSFLFSKHIEPNRVRVVGFKIKEDLTDLGLRLGEGQLEALNNYIEYLCGELGWAMFTGKVGEPIKNDYEPIENKSGQISFLDYDYNDYEDEEYDDWGAPRVSRR